MEIFQVLIAFLGSMLMVGGFLFYKIIKDKNSEIKELSNNKQNLEIKNTELIANLSNLNNIKDLYAECSKQLEEKKQESNQFKEDLTKTKALLNEQINKYNAFEKSQSERVDDLKNENLQLRISNENKSSEIGELKESLSKHKTSLEEQKEKNTEQTVSLSKRAEELKDEITSLKSINLDYNEQIKDQQSTISKLEIQLEEQHKAMEEKVELLQNSEEKLKIEFENLATKIFADNSKKFSEQNQETLGHLLNPMKAQLIDFKKKVEDVYDKEAKDRSLLSAELKTLKELNQKMSAEAHNLTNALKSDSKKQGKWGEMVLEKVLENSGLREGYEFKREVSLKDDENKPFRPDVIVYLPDDRHIIIDAKTSLTAYNDYMSEENDEFKQTHLKNHIKSVKEHIKGLADKKYEDLQNVNSLDFIFMFVPIEGALLLALDNDVNLYDEAFKQKIILVSPTTLLVALRAVENTWRYERQAQNVADVYKRTEELYKKFHGFIDDLKKVDKGLETARANYDEAFKKLSGGRGNLISQVTMLKKVSNIKPKKELDNTLVDGAMIDVLENKEL